MSVATRPATPARSTTGRARQVMRRPWLWLVVGVALLAVMSAVLRYAPIFAAEHVKVVGNTQITSDDVVDAAAIPDGTRLLTAPLDDIEQRVESLDAVADARVTRDWPNTIKIVVRERRPVGYVELLDGVGLVGSDGSLYRVERAAPRDLPELPDVPVSDVGDSYRSHLSAPGLAAFDVASALPSHLRRRVVSVTATDERSVELTSDDGVVVQWGSSGSSDAKSAVLALLMSRQGWGTAFTEVNITAPDAPAVR